MDLDGEVALPVAGRTWSSMQEVPGFATCANAPVWMVDRWASA